jgi:predicted CXXCH cytochrome family protein
MSAIIALSVFLLAPVGPADAMAIRNSKHDLSSTSATTGPKSTAEGQVCVFCHTPHRSGINVPLWNKVQTSQAFTFYSSNYLNTYLGMTPPTMASLSGTRTKLCLSCHDGVTALGGVYNIGGAAGTIPMSGGVGAAANMGTDLSNDHPVLYDVKPGAGPPSAPGTNPEIQFPPGGDPVKVYGATNRVECTSCHDPHDNQYGGFLAKSNANAALCTTCHVKASFSGSAHATSAVSYTPAGGTPTTVGEWACRNCHRAHGASAAQAYLLAGAEQATCYQCHGNPPLTGAKNIQSLFAKTYKHPTETVAGVHKDPEQDGTNFTYSPANKRHAECQDCHNPHQAKTGTHSPPTNLISNVLLGQWGVEPAYGATSWVPASSFTRQVFTNTTGFKEYQLCLKCHSSYAFSTSPPPTYTDVSTELNPNNRGAHPVRAGLNSQTGSTSPKPLVAAQMSAPWATNLGTQAMYCSDCHGEDTAGEPKGTHGSSIARMKKGTGKYWPKNSAGAFYTLGNKNANDSHLAGLFCRNCHPLRSATANTWYNNVHQEHSGAQLGNVACVACHSVVPHGTKRSRLIGYASEPAPYNAGGAGAYEKLVLSGFKKAASRTGYSKSNCYSTASGCTTHNNAGGYDP